MGSWLIEFADNEQKEVTTAELKEMEIEAVKLHGFYSWVVIRKLGNAPRKREKNEKNI